MPALSDRQRVELALPAYLFLALTTAQRVFIPTDPALEEKAKADLTTLRDHLRTACLEPFDDLSARKREAMTRRVERAGKSTITGWTDRPAILVMMTLYRFLEDLIDREVLILWEGSAMAEAMRWLVPMFEQRLENAEQDAAARIEAGALLTRLQREGLYT
ncbi:MAG: hypothetical protein K2Y56_17165 [Methylobacterium sp.]|uniref:hypothetical protein n=1 Tax=Methylobacterium sp. TaxID=409 RepID=UPI0025EB7368|nr:hypothetical protein [Methylobacterium sp.]MBX9933239.1 hypothetical protein [Methylobacterium sp.]